MQSSKPSPLLRSSSKRPTVSSANTKNTASPTEAVLANTCNNLGNDSLAVIEQPKSTQPSSPIGTNNVLEKFHMALYRNKFWGDRAAESIKAITKEDAPNKVKKILEVIYKSCIADIEFLTSTNVSSDKSTELVKALTDILTALSKGMDSILEKRERGELAMEDKTISLALKNQFENFETLVDSLEHTDNLNILSESGRRDETYFSNDLFNANSLLFNITDDADVTMQKIEKTIEKGIGLSTDYDTLIRSLNSYCYNHTGYHLLTKVHFLIGAGLNYACNKSEKDILTQTQLAEPIDQIRITEPFAHIGNDPEERVPFFPPLGPLTPLHIEYLKENHPGSQHHPYGCRPCHFSSPGSQTGCLKGTGCSFCHICPKPKRKSKHQRDVDKKRNEKRQAYQNEWGLAAVSDVIETDNLRQIMNKKVDDLKTLFKETHITHDTAKRNSLKRFSTKLMNSVIELFKELETKESTDKGIEQLDSEPDFSCPSPSQETVQQQCTNSDSSHPSPPSYPETEQRYKWSQH